MTTALDTDFTEELLTVSEVARVLRVDDTTIRRWVKLKALQAVVLPHMSKRQGYRIKRSTLDKVLSSSSIQTDYSTSSLPNKR